MADAPVNSSYYSNSLISSGAHMTDEYDESKWFFDRRTDKTIISRRFTDRLSGQTLRIASHIVEGQSGLKFATAKDEMVLRVTPAGRYEIKATFLEDDRSIRTLTIQRYSSKSGPLDKQHFSFVGREIDTLISFIAGVKTVPLDGAAKVHLPDEVLRDIVLDQGQARRISSRRIRNSSSSSPSRRTSLATSSRSAIDGSSCSASSPCSVTQAISPASRSVSDAGPRTCGRTFSRPTHGSLATVSLTSSCPISTTES